MTVQTVVLNPRNISKPYNKLNTIVFFRIRLYVNKNYIKKKLFNNLQFLMTLPKRIQDLKAGTGSLKEKFF
jgi:hypothetical protein